MSLYRVTNEKLESVSRTSFAAENLLERKDLQRLLRKDITPIGDDLMVIAEEYGDWEESSRRIDLLCLSKDATLVVVEIKRTEDGGHMELQAIRYAAMVSSMTLDQAVQAYAQFQGTEVQAARVALLVFLKFESEDEEELTGEVRIVLVSANFSTELTTAVMWLNRHELDITCIRLIPYRMGDEVLIDATKIIPLPETTEYEVKVRAQEQEKRKAIGIRQENLRKFWTQLIERSKTQTPLLANRSPSDDHWISAGIGRSGFNLSVGLAKNEGQAECYIGLPVEGHSKLAFKALLAQKAEIEKKFGEELEWQELPGRNGCRIRKVFPGGWKNPESEWPAMQDRLINGLIRIESALKKAVQELKF